VGQFPTDLFDGRPDPLGDAAVAQLGRPLLARLSAAFPFDFRGDRFFGV
jgi:hypothetical protein